MFKACKHKWEEIESTYTPPNNSLKQVNGVDMYTLRELMEGRTNTKLKCKNCGDIKYVGTIGKA